MASLFYDKEAKIIHAVKSTSRYLDEFFKILQSLLGRYGGSNLSS